jgi:TorA maturation chaperone TorD
MTLTGSEPSPVGRSEAAFSRSGDHATDGMQVRRGGMLAQSAEVDAARAQEYALLARLLARAPDRGLLERLAKLEGDATRLGAAHGQLASAAHVTDPETIEREYFDLFVGVGRGEVLPYGSYYLSGFLYERPLARLRGDLAELGLVRAEENCEPEDHIGSLCEIMAGIISGRFPALPGAEERIFKKHLEPWAARFFADLERARSAKFYRSVGGLGRVFMAVESEAWTLPA